MKTIVLLVAFVCIIGAIVAEEKKCLASAGYTWCEYENRCVRPWELAKLKNLENTAENIASYCNLKRNNETKPSMTSDSHGCVASAGYSWCEKEQSCVRPWELASLRNIQNTAEAFAAYCSPSTVASSPAAASPVAPPPKMGGSTDSHGCIGSAGYTWCAAEGKCIRPWELSNEKGFVNSAINVRQYCSGLAVVTGAPIPQSSAQPAEKRDAPVIQTTSHQCAAGAGYTWCEKEGKCVRPWILAKEQNIENSFESFTAYCSVAPAHTIGGQSDNHGCVAGAGYTWCGKEGKCVRPWELAKTAAIENTPEAFAAYCAQ